MKICQQVMVGGEVIVTRMVETDSFTISSELLEALLRWVGQREAA